MIEDMNSEEMKEMKQKVIGMCICRSCPTYVQAADPIGYYFPTIGKNVKIVEEEQCIYPACPVFAQQSLTKTFFCTRGSEKEQKRGV